MSAVSFRNKRAFKEVVKSLKIALGERPTSEFLLDTNHSIVMASEQFCEVFKTSQSRIVGKGIQDLSRWQNFEHIRDAITRCLSGDNTHCIASGTLVGGESVVLHMSFSPVQVNGRVAGALATTEPSSPVEVIVPKGTRSSNNFQSVAFGDQVGTWSVNASTRVLTMSTGALKLLGIDAMLADESTIDWERIHPDDRQLAKELLDNCLARGESFSVELLVTRFTGEDFVVRVIGEAETDVTGNIARALGVIIDCAETAELRKHERALERQLELTLNSIADGIIFTGSDEKVTFANQHALELLGVKPSTEQAVTLDDLFARIKDQSFRDSFTLALEGDEQRVVRGSGVHQGQWIECRTYLASEGLVLYLRDVTSDEQSRRLAEQVNAKLHQQAALIDAARDAIIVRDLGLRVHYWNKAAEELYGWTREEALGQTVTSLIYSDRHALDRATAMLIRDGFFVDEMSQVTRDGRQVIVDCRWQLIDDLRGEKSLVLSVDSDITAWRQEQDARSRAGRTQALGTFAGGIAHDLNNVLTPILMSVQLMALDETDQTRRELLAAAEAAARRGSEMVRQVLSYVRGVEGQRVTVDVNRLLDEFISITRDSLTPNIRFDIHRSEQLSETIGDPTQILQVLLNVALNARDAMSNGGTLTFRAEERNIGEITAFANSGVEPGLYVVMSIEDTGHGIDAQTLEHIFEPFFTTKSSGKGTGLGLATSLAIVRSHDGWLDVESEPGMGSTFTIGIPVVSQGGQLALADRQQPVANPIGHGELILLVEDDDDIRQVATVTLEQYGYRVASARNGHEAIDLLDSAPEAFKLVFTDMVMPGMDGATLSAYLEEFHPDVPVVAASGYTASGGSASIGLGIARFIAKPYTTSSLLTSIRDTLREHRASRRPVDD